MMKHLILFIVIIYSDYVYLFRLLLLVSEIIGGKNKYKNKLSNLFFFIVII